MTRPRALAVLSRAKINLYLRILGRRDDGYHDLETVMVPVSLADTVRIDLEASELTLVCDHPQVPDGPENLAHRAAAAFFDAAGLRPAARIHLVKRVPVAAGLGGGSGNAAAVLMGLDRLFDHPLPFSRLLDLGRTLGADVPFFVAGRVALARGIGDCLSDWTGPLPEHLVLVCPPISVSTPWVYRQWDARLTSTPAWSILNSPRAGGAGGGWVNDLEAVTIPVHPVVGEIKAALLESGAGTALMSGSGPSVFGVFDSGPAAARARRRLADLGLGRSWHVRTEDRALAFE